MPWQMAYTLSLGSLFSGIGGFELGFERTGQIKTIWQVEIDDYCRRVLAKHWPAVQRFADVRDVGKDNLPHVDIICGGFPCQDISNAGKRAGIDGERSGLWSEYARIIRELRPRYVVVENVAALLGRGMERVLGDLAACGYDAEWQSIRASDVGAPHRRERIWIVAYPNGERRGRIFQPFTDVEQHPSEPAQFRDGQGEAITDVANSVSGRFSMQGQPSGRSGFPTCGGKDVAYPARDVGTGLRRSRERTGTSRESGGRALGFSTELEKTLADATSARSGECSGDVADAMRTGQEHDQESDARESGITGWAASSNSSLRGFGSWWAVEPDVGRVAHGVPSRVDRLRGLGNAIVPQIAEFIGTQIVADAFSTSQAVSA